MQFGVTHAGQPNHPLPVPALRPDECPYGGNHVWVKNAEGKLRCNKCGAP